MSDDRREIWLTLVGVAATLSVFALFFWAVTAIIAAYPGVFIHANR